MDFKLTTTHGTSSLTSLALHPLPPSTTSSKTLLHRSQPPPPQKQNDTIQPIQPKNEDLTTTNELSGNEAGSQDMTPSSPTSELSISKVRGITVIVTLSGINFLNTMGSGILIAALPRIAQEVGLSQSLILWPAAVYSLAAGCLLLIFGSIADVVGPKWMWLTGSLLYVGFTIGVGLAKTAIQIITFRTLLGISIAMCLPSAVSLITNTFPKGTWRNTAFAINGMGHPLGFAMGLVLGGIFTDTIGWRWAYYMMAIINICLSTASVWSLPNVATSTDRHWKTRLIHDIDWAGAVILSVGLGMLLYVLAMVSSSYRKLSDVPTIVVLAISLILLISFPFWMEYQVRRGKPALIPNKLWRNWSFTTVCVAVFFCWASLTGTEYFTTLYFQEVQDLTALQSSIRFLPHVIAGASTNVVTALLIARVNVRTLSVVSALITLVAAPLMATIPIGQNYWFSPFWALFLSPVNTDVLFTVSNLVISAAYPPELQSLAGGVFYEVAQFGNSVGLAITAAIAASVTEHSNLEAQKEALMQGYRAAFWTIFACCTTVTAVVWFGLRKSGIVGKKDD